GEVYRVDSDHREVARAIKDMVIRGAPAVGVAAAMGIALGARTLRGDFGRHFARLCRTFAATRPTAVNLFWAIERMRRVFARNRRRSPDTLRTLLEREALAIHDEDVAANRRLGAHGAALVEDGAIVLTHCNAGALATAGYGTALGIVRAAVEAAPTSSISLPRPDGTHIPIEERAPREVTHVFDRQIAPSGVRVANPAFDVTPAELVSAIVTERGVARQPLAPALARLVSGRARRRAGRVERSLEPRRERRR